MRPPTHARGGRAGSATPIVISSLIQLRPMRVPVRPTAHRLIHQGMGYRVISITIAAVLIAFSHVDTRRRRHHHQHRKHHRRQPTSLAADRPKTPSSAAMTSRRRRQTQLNASLSLHNTGRRQQKQKRSRCHMLAHRRPPDRRPSWFSAVAKPRVGRKTAQQPNQLTDEGSALLWQVSSRRRLHASGSAS